ncbi:hypothetical protein ACQKFE_18100 [Stutzerimonas stutzeri]|uniref:ring-hydroxylating oxygenase subunit alpha n=1 Tax=Pseudomonadaceae TaxID=135621 RepID=UPI000FD3841C|nr:MULTISPECIES: ring-hydroxylating oxygenase subunit alpha [Pseudomonadaceae]RUI10438.1 ring-hydroxylating oxygenase subunit alpha [Pseudomonas aeruginosa]UIP31942.1 hypothetical protein LW136_17700 [Stutzerimonas kunmingensis]
MSRRPELGYFEGGVDLCASETYADCIAQTGPARLLPLAAYRSLSFAYLEDERIWTRDWVCIGTQRDVPHPGDLLPYTLGNHGIHVQRQEDGSLRGAFNKAQHGGCRVVPLQCQGGRKTSCSFTSCGYSRDRGPISADELGDGASAMHQYLGLRPERLLPVRVQILGELIFVNLDPEAPPLATTDLGARSAVLEAAATRVVHWREYDADWKLLGQHLLEAGPGRSMIRGDDIFEVRSDAMLAFWGFPNLLMLAQGNETCLVLLQPTALGKTLCRIHLFSTAAVAGGDEQGMSDRWLGLINQRGMRAVAFCAQLDRPIPASINETTPQTDPAGRWAQACLVRRITAEARYEGDLKLYGNVRNYLL